MVVKYLSHVLHWWGFSPVWVIICTFNLLLIKNIFHKHCNDKTFHLYESPYVLQICYWLKKTFHKVHMDMVFSPVCVNKCVFKLPMVVKYLSHVLHWWGISPVWVTICTFNLLLVKKFFPQILHEYGFALYESTSVCLNYPLL